MTHRGSKALVILAALLVVVLILAACAQPQASAPKPAPATTPAPAPAQKIVLRLGHHLAPTHDIHKIYTEFAAAFNERAKGKVVIEVYPAEQIVKATETLDAVKSGAVEMAHIGQAYFTGAEPLFDIVNVPFLYKTQEETDKAAKLMEAAVFTDLYAKKYNQMPLWSNGAGAMQAFTTKKQVKALADWKGLQVRGAGGLQNKTLEALGASTVAMPSSDVYAAMQKGVVDGMVTTWSGGLGGKFNEVSKYLTICNMFNPASAVTIGLQAWNRLPPDMQKLLKDTSEEYRLIETKRLSANDKTVADKLKAAGMVAYDVPPDELAKWRTAVAPVIDGFVKSTGAQGQKLIDIARSVNP